MGEQRGRVALYTRSLFAWNASLSVACPFRPSRGLFPSTNFTRSRRKKGGGQRRLRLSRGTSHQLLDTGKVATSLRPPLAVYEPRPGPSPRLENTIGASRGPPAAIFPWPPGHGRLCECWQWHPSHAATNPWARWGTLCRRGCAARVPPPRAYTGRRFVCCSGPHSPRQVSAARGSRDEGDRQPVRQEDTKVGQVLQAWACFWSLRNCGLDQGWPGDHGRVWCCLGLEVRQPAATCKIYIELCEPQSTCLVPSVAP